MVDLQAVCCFLLSQVWDVEKQRQDMYFLGTPELVKGARVEYELIPCWNAVSVRVQYYFLCPWHLLVISLLLVIDSLWLSRCLFVFFSPGLF